MHRGKGFFIVDVVRLSIPFGNEPGFESIDRAVDVMFNFVDPSTAYWFLVRHVGDEISCLVFA